MGDEGMSVEQATPGPWTHNEGNPTRIIGPDDETVAVLYGGKVGIQRQFENAALIVAAPVLYQYVTQQASIGDADAQQIVDTLPRGLSSAWAYDDSNPRRIIEESETIASVFGGMGGDSTQLANARLIGAAPAMRNYARARSNAGDEAATRTLDAIPAA